MPLPLSLLPPPALLKDIKIQLLSFGVSSTPWSLHPLSCLTPSVRRKAEEKAQKGAGPCGARQECWPSFPAACPLLIQSAGVPWSALDWLHSAFCSARSGWQPGAEPCSLWGCVSARAAVTCQAELGTGSAWRGDMLLNLEALLHSKMHFSWQLPCREAVEPPCLCQDHSHFFLEKETGLQTVLLIKAFFFLLNLFL